MKLQSRTSAQLEIAFLRAEAEAWKAAFEELAADEASRSIRHEFLKIELYALISQGYDIQLRGALNRILTRL